MKIYVAGPMTNLPEYNLPAFALATDRLKMAGYRPVNPGRHGVNPAYTWQDYIRRGLIELLQCEAVALLPGWENSQGAALEVHVAKALKMDVEPLSTWLERAA